MSAARLILLPLFVIDVTTLAQATVARPAEKLSIPLTAATKLGDASGGIYAMPVAGLLAIGIREDQKLQIVLAAEEKLPQESVAQTEDAKIGHEEPNRGTNEKSAVISAPPKASPGGKGPAIAQPSSQKKPKAPVLKSEEQKPSVEKSPSILQMLEGHESEILAAAAIALAFFFIGWICGGNYYLRRDRRQRTKLRF